LVIATSSVNPSLATARDFTANVDWQNGSDAVQLIDPFLVIIDALQYGDAGVNNADFGAPRLDPPAGSSLSRDLFGSNAGDNASEFLVRMPSPGIGPTATTPQPVPEPSTLLLLTCGLLLLVAARRYRCSLLRLQLEGEERRDS
jgi:hypothetical protein